MAVAIRGEEITTFLDGHAAKADDMAAVSAPLCSIRWLADTFKSLKITFMTMQHICE